MKSIVTFSAEICSIVCRTLATLTLCLTATGSLHGQTLGNEAMAQIFPFTRLLYTNEVKAIHQDQQGFIWLGTTSGLARWDGHRLVTLRCDWLHPALLTHNDLHCMADASEWMWMGTANGVSCYHQTDGHFATPTDHRILNGYINDVEADGQGGVWVAAKRRIFHWDGNDSLRTECVNPFHGICDECEINTLYTDRKGRLWVVCYDNVLLRLTQTNGKRTVERMPPIPVKAELSFLRDDSQDRLWVGTWGHGLWQLLSDSDEDGTPWRQHDFSDKAAGVEDRFTFSMAEGGGLLWLLTYERLHALRYESGQLTDLDLSDVIPTNKMFTDMLRDREGNLWLSSYDDGYIIRFNTPGISNYRLPALTRLLQHDANLKGLLADGQRYVWLNQDRNGILLLDTETGNIAAESPRQWKEMSLLVPSIQPHSAWVGERNYAVAHRLVHDGMTVRTAETIDLRDIVLNSAPFTAIHETREGNLWLLTPNRLFLRMNDNRATLLSGESEHFTAMTPTHDGVSVLCTARQRLFYCYIDENDSLCYHEESHIINLKTNEDVRLMAIDGENRLWLITTLGRILRSDAHRLHYEQLPLTVRLAGEEVQDLRQSGNTMWLMTDKQLVAYDLKTTATHTFHAGANDICVRRFLLRALDVDSTGHVLAGGYGGFVRLKLSQTQSASSDTTECIRATDVLQNGHSVLFGNHAATENTFAHVTLSADAKNIEVHLATLQYGSGSLVPLQYRLEGVDADWVNADAANPSAFYNHLPRGNHTLLVRQLQADGTWGQPFKAVTLERRPHWYETWWAFAVYLLLATVLLLLLIKYIRARQARKVRTKVTQAKMSLLSASHPFTEQAMSIVLEHLSDSDFGLEELSSTMNTSKSTLHRRIKAEVDMTPLELINSIRLKRACELLADGNDCTVAEVAYTVGFASPKYFTQCFKAEYGVTPTEYRKHTNV